MRDAWRRTGAALLVAVALAGGAPAARGAEPVGDDKVTSDLRAFCKKWMGFLEKRESDNRRGVKWQQKAPGVSGTFVGYSTDYDCIMKERSSNGTPVATIVYREYLYTAEGPTQSEALLKPTVVEATEVTEIFRYTKGEWVY
jgi:hypothetical protein